MDFRDTGMESGGYERLPSVSTFMSVGRTSMDYPLDGSYPVDSPYGQSQTPNMGSYTAAFEGDLGGIATEGHAGLALDPRLQSSGRGYGEQGHSSYPGCESQ